MSRKEYDHKKIENKWQKEWAKAHIYKTAEKSDKPKYYILDMFPYPSGQGLHVGHPKGYIATDILSRYKRMKGFNVLHPMGWDAFGLPAENYALKNKTHPKKQTDENVTKFKEQLEILGLDYDWTREINTTDPEYYKWTQWIFIKLFEKGLAYESNEPINWCPSCKTGLANEDLEDGNKCERCGSTVEKKPIRQWVLKIRQYADRLLDDLEELDWPESIKESQRNWIGRSEGSEIEFEIKNFDKKITIFTTRADTLFGCTYVVLAPEHPYVKELLPKAGNASEIENYIKESESKDEIERTSLEKEKTGVKLEGIYAINPANNEEVPVYIADYVLSGYGTGAVMAVPAHDERDFQFAKKYNLSIKRVINSSSDIKKTELDSAFVDDGLLINSSEFDGLDSELARERITKKVSGKMKVNYKIRDWIFSRQRYWGEPIPIVHCDKCGTVAVPESDLPVKLPDVESYEPTGTGESPLANISDWVNTTCPKCRGTARRETNTMPQWAGSSWYYLRYLDPHNSEKIFDSDSEKYWMPVDFYVGGAEHATRHLIYARFWHKFLNDIGIVSTKEPFKKLLNVGLIMASDGRKMSKRWNNVVNPNDVVAQFGADTMRIFEMFLGPFEKSANWNTESIIGPRRFLERVWKLQEKISPNTNDSESTLRSLNKTIKKVGEDIENINFNTAISEMMIFQNRLDEAETISIDTYNKFLKILAPFAPHITEEIFHNLGNKNFINAENWPQYDEKLTVDQTVKIAIQVNGKVRADIEIDPTLPDEEVKELALNLPDLSKWTHKKIIKKFIYVKGKVVNFVVD